MRKIVVFLISIICLAGYAQNNLQNGKYFNVTHNLTLNIYNNQATLNGFLYEDKPFCVWGGLTKNDTAFVLTSNNNPSEYFAYYRNNKKVDSGKRKITVKTHKAPYQTEFAIGKDLSMSDLKRLDDLDEDALELSNDTTVFTFYVDKQTNDTAMISRMVYSSYVEFHYALPDDANDIVFVRNDVHYYYSTSPTSLIVLHVVGDKIYLEKNNPEAAFSFEGKLNKKEIETIQQPVPVLSGYKVLQKNRCFVPVHEDSPRSRYEEFETSIEQPTWRNDTLFFREEKGKIEEYPLYHSIFIDTNKQSSYYNSITDFELNEYDEETYNASLERLKENNLELEKKIIKGLPLEWIQLRQYDEKFYVYHPCDFMSHYQASITDSTFIDYTGEGPIASKISGFEKLDDKTFRFYLNKGYGERILNIHIIDDESKIAVFEDIPDANMTAYYDLMIAAEKAREVPIIVNVCDGMKQSEFEFEEPDYNELLNRK